MMKPFHFNNLNVFTLPVGQLNANCYLVSDSKTLDTLIIDPGDDADYIERVIADHSLRPLSIIATHGHFDHIMAAFELQTAYSIPFLIHKKDEFLVKDLQARAKYWLGIESPPPPVMNEFLKEKDTVKIDSSMIEVLETPGHTPGGVCLYEKSEKVVFVGDLIFENGGIGRTDFSYSSEKDLRKSIDKILKFPQQTRVFPGHGESFMTK